MVIPLLLPVAGAAIGRMFGKSGAEREAAERIDLIKQAAGLTQEQSAAVDALQEQSTEEIRERVRTRVGPFAPLPASASPQAQAAYARRVAKLQDRNVGQKFTPTTQTEAVVEAAVKRKMSEMLEE